MVPSEASARRRAERVPSYGWQAAGSRFHNPVLWLIVHPMFYTYILESLSIPGELYRGHAHNLKLRLAEHNAGKCSHTAKFRPWKVILRSERASVMSGGWCPPKRLREGGPSAFRAT